MIHSDSVLDIFRENGYKIAQIREQLAEMAQEVTDTSVLDTTAEQLIKKAGGEPAFKRVKGYHWTTCLCINDGFVHCIPGRKIQQGDILTIDIGMYYHGTTTDTATTIIIGENPQVEHFLAVGKKALKKGINQAKIGNSVRDITKALQKTIEKSGYSVTRNLTGHGLGETMHEDPQIPLYNSSDPSLKVPMQAGMVLAIEAMYMEGDWPIVTDEDGWTIRTADGSLSGMFEDDVIITQAGPEIITRVE